MKNKNKILSNRIVILLIFIFHFLFIPAQNIRDLEKVNKVYIKEWYHLRIDVQDE